MRRTDQVSNHKTGMAAIMDRYNLSARGDVNLGCFKWQQRMGIHLAFHRNPTNIAMHALFSIVNAWAVLLIAFPFSFSGLTLQGVPIDMAMVTLLIVFITYAAMDVGAAFVSTFLYALTYPLCQPVFNVLGESALLMALLGIILWLKQLKALK